MYKTKGTHNYYVYILTNKNKTVLYIGVTNSLQERLYWHQNPDPVTRHFTHKYSCYYLIYYEHFTEMRKLSERKATERMEKGKERNTNQ
jgi:putative endonuclease